MTTTLGSLSATEINALPFNNPLRFTAWQDATADLRKAVYDAALERYMEEEQAKKKTEKSDLTWTQKKRAMGYAQGDVIKALYELPAVNGLNNPIHEDPEWSPTATKAQAKTAAKDNARPNKYGGRCPKCDAWVEAEAGNLVKLPSGKWGAEHKTCPDVRLQPETSPEKSGCDLTNVPSGYYAVPNGETRLKLRIAHGKEGSKWEGYTFVTDGAEYGQQQRYGMQRPGQAYSGQVEAALTAVAADPKAAMAAYGQLTGTCGKCGRKLEDEDSVKRGIGPICANGW